jgi:Tfp pilus assembly protein FimT
MLVAATAAVLAAAAVPSLTAGIERTRTASAARYLAGRLASARSFAVSRSANVAVLLTKDGDTLITALYADGNGNGVRTREIAAGIDPPVGDAVRFSDQFPHVTLSLDDLSLDDPDQGQAIETSALLSFSPLGSASSRTIYVRGRDGSRYAVRLLGATGRTRVLRYVAATRAWVEVL